MTLIPWLSVLLLLSPVSAQEPPSLEEVAPAPKEEAKAPEAKAEEKAPEAKPEPKPEPKAAPKDHGPAYAGLDAEWAFVQAAAKDLKGPAGDAAVEEAEAFVDRNPSAPMAADALYLLASQRQKRGESGEAMAGHLRLLYGYPTSKLALQAKSAFLDLAGKASRASRGPLADLAKGPDGGDEAARLFSLLQRLSTIVDESLYAPSVAEARRFQKRFHQHPEADRVQWALALLHEKNERAPAAVLAYRRLMAVHPGSALKPRALFAIAGLYSESLKEPQAAIEAYQELVAQYPDSADVLPALERTAGLLEKQRKQYALAAEVLEKIVALFPKTDSARRALEGVARLQRERLGSPGDAIKTWIRLSEAFGAPAGVAALRSAAEIARRDLRDYAKEIELRQRLAKDYPAAKEAPAELYAVAEIYESDLKDVEKALAAYQEVASKFAASKEGKKAAERAARLEKKKQG